MFRFGKHDNGIARRVGISFRNVFRLRRECFQERRAGKGQSPEQIPQRKRRIGFHSCLIVHAGDTRQLSLEMRDRARRRIVCIEITESPAQQPEQFGSR